MTQYTVDLKFLGRNGEIAAYLIQSRDGIIIVDPGPESTLPTLQEYISSIGLQIDRIRYVLVTHIHLDHAGAAGWFAQRGARVFVHPVGAPHLLSPERLLTSAARLYGDLMDSMWGSMQPVPADMLYEIKDREIINLGGQGIEVLFTPGHAEHHAAYIHENTIFTGDVGGVRYAPHAYVRLPFVPPETAIEKWRQSLQKLVSSSCARIAPTHFGVFDDGQRHLLRAIKFLDDVEEWLERIMPGMQDAAGLSGPYIEFIRQTGLRFGLDDEQQRIYDTGSPPAFAASGLYRYWNKVRQ